MKTELRLIRTIGQILLALAVGVALAAGGALSVAAAGPTGQIDIVGPAGSCVFGMTVTVLPNGNIVASDPCYSAGAVQNVGAVYLYDGATGTLISALTGSSWGDFIGTYAYGSSRAPALIVLGNGNFLVGSPDWDNAALGATDAGAVTWVNGTTGLSGAVSADNSLVGSTASDQVGYWAWYSAGATELSNGNYVVDSPYWDNVVDDDSGAVSWGNGGTGATAGPITADNSVLGTAGGGGDSLVWAYDHHYPINQLVVGRPADNIVTLFVLPTGQAVFLPAVLKNAP